MSTSTKQQSKQSKTEKSEKINKTEKSANLEKTDNTENTDNSDMEEDKHSILNGDFKKNPTEAKYFKKHFDLMKTEFLDEESAAKIIRFIYGGTYEELSKLVKQKEKKETVKKATFVAEDLDKPKKAIDLFGVKFSKESKEQNVKFGNQYFILRKTAWDNLSDKERRQYEKEAEEALEKYNIEFAKQKELAIKNGDFPAEKIKGPCTAYFLYLADIRPKLNEQFKDEPNKNIKITKEGGRLWSALSEKAKEKYEIAYKKSKAEYEIKKAEWVSNETDRCKKQAGKPVDVKIDSSGKKTVAKPKSSKKSDSDSQDEEAEAETNEETNDDSEAEPVVEEAKVEIKSTKKSSAKAKASVKTEKLADVAEVEEVAEVEVTKKVKAKSKAK
jgi:hypothetical protein